MCRSPNFDKPTKSSVCDPTKAAKHRDTFNRRHPNYFRDRYRNAVREDSGRKRLCKRCSQDITGKGKKGSCQYCEKCRLEKVEEDRIKRVGKNPQCLRCGSDIVRVRRARKWCKACVDLVNAEMHKVIKQNRRAAESNSEGKLTTVEWQDTLERSGGKCHYCGEPGTTMDHVVPLSRNGIHGKENIVVACMRCNTRKGSKLLSEWTTDN